MDALKKERLEALNKEFEDRKRAAQDQIKDRQISEASQKLVDITKLNTPSSASLGHHRIMFTPSSSTLKPPHLFHSQQSAPLI